MPRAKLFDPFGDLETRGYLQNAKGYQTATAVKRFEHNEYEENAPSARKALQTNNRLTYTDLLDTHRRLFGNVYPTWAGQDRLAVAPYLAINKGIVRFALPSDIRRAAMGALTEGADPKIMSKHPGEIMGILAYAHPFLDGNGRTFLTVHSELARRAEISVDWRSMPHRDYLAALTNELNYPNEGHLDRFMAPYVLPNPDRILIPDHQAVFTPPPSAARTAAIPSGPTITENGPAPVGDDRAASDPRVNPAAD